MFEEIEKFEEMAQSGMHDAEHEDRQGRRISSFSCIELYRGKNFFPSVFIITYLGEDVLQPGIPLGVKQHFLGTVYAPTNATVQSLDINRHMKQC